MLETDIQNQIKLAASQAGWKLWRNNVGVLIDSRGVPVRYGLANESKSVNSRVKSADLIGIRPVIVTQEMVGTVIGQFVSLECKRPGWSYNQADEHQRAQNRWIEIVTEAGGYAKFTCGEL